jgi:hypothetical protein
MKGYMRDTCGIHAGYMRDTCILSGNQDTCWTHARYMRDTCGIHAGYISRGLGECFDAIIIAKVTDTNVSWCILMYLDVSWCLWTGHIEIHARYMQDTCRIHKDTYCIGNHPQFV